MSAHSEPSSDLPLAGRTVVVTRPRARAGPFETMLRDRGARVVSFPTIRIAPLEDDSRLREALERLSEHDWLVFTSVNAVEAVAPLLPSGATLPPAAGAVRIAAIGPATAAAVRDRLGAQVEAVPAEYRAEALAEAILAAAGDVSGLSFLLPRAAEAREALPRMLEEAGAHVLEVAAYRTLAADDREAGALRNDLAAGRIDWVTFTASSTVRGFTEAVGTDLGPSRVAAIGPITAATARSLGLEVDVVAEAYTIPGLLQALVDAERNGSDVTGRGG